ncbi:ferric reductase family protein [Aspergillus mulundensis]|uniref:FAD-binding FR-type domain-containing protein n=1 Tax=Aspergillus mulundensis TaxID=1810919 RepID=A0A3D8RS74_9EURO|nr:hypothetical protein DSM5745_06802 [Aspergillus mulundensis]RDW76810.1 hypothetical protein DSM5745_06802 [Aspergillus mulundensis]
MKFFVCLSLLATAASARSSIVPVNERCVDSITTAYTYVTFAGSPSRKFLEQRCRNPLAVTSIYASADIYCRPNEREAGIRRLEWMCEEADLELLSREKVKENLTEDAILHMRRVDYLELDMGTPVRYPVLLSAEHYRRVFLTMNTWAYESWTHYAYGYAFLVPLTAMSNQSMQIHRLPVLGMHSLARDAEQDAEPLHHLPLRRENPALATLALTTNLPLPPNTPPRPDCLPLPRPGVALLDILKSCRGPRHPRLLDSQHPSLRRIISFANLPLLWLFAGRNNICAWATGWNFATFNVFHRHVAWIATIQAVVHTVLYLVLFFQNSNPWRKLQKPYLLWGTLAMALMLLILPPAVTWFRHRAYETFLFIHIVFSIGLLVGCFYHTIIFETHEYWFYLWLPVGIWAFDRGLRILRVVYCNIHVHVLSNSRHKKKIQLQTTTSTASYDEAADLIRLDVIPGAGAGTDIRLRPGPGQYYFLYQPFRWTGWESHPFTLGSWGYIVRPAEGNLKYTSKSGQTTPTALKGDEEVDVSQIPLLSDSSSDSHATLTHAHTDGPSGEVNVQLKLTFYIRPYNGWTRALRDQCRASPNLSSTSTSTILLEGPYGTEFPVWRYESVLLIAGGTGIASAVPYIQDHIARSAGGDHEEGAGDEEAEGPGTRTRVRNMQLLWVTRQEEFIRDLARNELGPALGRGDFTASFFATATASDASALSRTGQRQRQYPRSRVSDARQPNIGIPTIVPGAERLGSGVDVDITPGRPNLEKIIATFAEEAHASDSSAAVLVCGPQRMADEVRAAVVWALGRGMVVSPLLMSITSTSLNQVQFTIMTLDLLATAVLATAIPHAPSPAHSTTNAALILQAQHNPRACSDTI